MLSCDISVSSMCSHLIYVGGVRVVGGRSVCDHVMCFFLILEVGIW